MLKQALIVVLVLTGNALWAQTDSAKTGNDIYTAGETVDIKGAGIDNVFAAGRIITINSDISGSAYLAGQNITLENKIGQNLYAAGQTILLQTPTLSNANLVGELVIIDTTINNDLRVAGDNVRINGDVGGDLLAAADTLDIKGTIKGDASIFASKLNFSANSRIKGYLTLYAEEAFNIPQHVIAAERIIYKNIADISDKIYQRRHDEHRTKHIFSKTLTILFIALIIFAIAALAHKKTTNAYTRGWQGIWGSLGYGFLVLSVLIGSIIVTALSLIGIPLSLLLILATITLWTLGYLMGNYFIVGRIWQAIRKQAVSTKFGILIVAILSAVSAAVIIGIPWLGWWLSIAVTLFGLGAMNPWRLRKSVVQNAEVSG